MKLKPEPPDARELEALARIRASNIADSTIALAYLVGDGQWDRAAQECIAHLQLLNQLAGCVSQLLPVMPPQDAPPI